MKVNHCKDKNPSDSTRCLAFSPNLSDGDAKRFRVLGGSFVKADPEIKQWIDLEEAFSKPKSEAEVLEDL